MKRLVLDTSYLVAHFNPDDAHHDAALRIEDAFRSGRWEELVLLDAAFGETMAVLMRRASYALAKQVGEVLQHSEEIQWVSLADHRDDAWHQFLAQPSETMSLVDCALVAVAEAYGTKDIATFDVGFDRALNIRRVPAG